MIELHTWDTPNGLKPLLFLEEQQLEYRLKKVDDSLWQQQLPALLRLNPAGSVPALVDYRTSKPAVLFESGAILWYLAETTAAFFPDTVAQKANAMSWLFWLTGGLGNTANHWRYSLNNSKVNDAAMERCFTESLRLLNALEQQLMLNDYVVGAHYSIADMMLYPSVNAELDLLQAHVDGRVPLLALTRDWLSLISMRPATQRAKARLRQL